MLQLALIGAIAIFLFKKSNPYCISGVKMKIRKTELQNIADTQIKFSK
jgi:hypothetical protein